MMWIAFAYALIGMVWASSYALRCAETDRTRQDERETMVGAAALLVAWPVFAVVKAWRAWE